MNNTLSCQRSVMLIVAILMAGARTADADHRDAPGVLTHPSASLNDAYAFVDPNDPSMVVLAMTVNGYTVPGINATFGSDCLYQFKIDNTGDFVEDLVIQIRFDEPLGSAFSPTQGFTVVGPVKPPKVGGINKVAKTNTPPITGPIVNVPATNPGAGVPVNTFTTAGNGMKVFCGVRDDAFTFDEIFLRNILRGTLAAPVPSNTFPFRSTPGIDYYAGLNCSTIVIELASSMLTGALTNTNGHKQLNIWATTSLPTAVTRTLSVSTRGEPPTGHEVDSKKFVQCDRAALPCISTFLINTEDKDAFSGGQPKDDMKFFAELARALIQKLQLDPASAAAQLATNNLLAIRFPDVLSLDVTSTAGFAAVDFSGAVPLPGNARRPQDDVISFELGLLTVGAVTNEGIAGSDGRVGGNDVPLLTTFPFFAPPHVPKEGVPKRN
jgi:Domain of unknown function (DUF4331)